MRCRNTRRRRQAPPSTIRGRCNPWGTGSRTPFRHSADHTGRNGRPYYLACWCNFRGRYRGGSSVSLARRRTARRTQSDPRTLSCTLDRTMLGSMSGTPSRGPIHRRKCSALSKTVPFRRCHGRCSCIAGCKSAQSSHFRIRSTSHQTRSLGQCS